MPDKEPGLAKWRIDVSNGPATLPVPDHNGAKPACLVVVVQPAVVSHPSRSRAGDRPALSVVAAWPDCLRRQSERLGQQALHRRPLLLQRFPRRRGVITIRHGKSGQAVSALFQSREHIGRMPVRMFNMFNSWIIHHVHGCSLSRKSLTKVAGYSPELAEMVETLAEKCRDYGRWTTNVT